MTMVIYIYLGFIIIMSFISLIMYISDKKKAIKGKIRIKEKNLLVTAVIGGAIGSLFGRLIAHHKTDKKYFSFVIYTSLLFQIITLGILVYLNMTL